MSTDTNNSKKWLLGISIFAILWNALGANAYIQQAYQTASFTKMYTPEQLEAINNMPIWATAAFAFAVFGGLLGSILLLLKKKLAKLVLLISLIGIFFQMVYNFFIANAIESYESGDIIMPVMILGIGYYLYWYAKKVDAEGLLS